MSAAKALANAPKPSGVMRSLSKFVVRYRVATRAPAADAGSYRTAGYKPEGSLAFPSVLDHASALGLSYVGTYEYRGYGGWIPREAWVSEDGDLRLSARRRQASGIEGAMSQYYLCTIFADGTGIITWAKSPPPVPPNERVQSLGGSGNLETDIATHRAAIARRPEGAAPIVASLTVDDCVDLSTFHDRFMTTDEVLSSIVSPRVFVWLLLVTSAALVAWLIARFLL